MVVITCTVKYFMLWYTSMRGKLLFWDPMSSKEKGLVVSVCSQGWRKILLGQSVPIRDYSSNIKYYQLYGIKLNKFANFYMEKSGNDKLGIPFFLDIFCRRYKGKLHWKLSLQVVTFIWYSKICRLYKHLVMVGKFEYENVVWKILSLYCRLYLIIFFVRVYTAYRQRTRTPPGTCLVREKY